MIKEENVKLNNIKTIFIDEAQFFADLYDKVLDLIIVRKINVVLVGLDGDFERKAFGNGDLLKLIPFASCVHKFISKCYICGQDAPFTKRLIASKEQIIVGGANIYQPACEEHFSNI
jgi:thymidine kinase